MDEIHLLPTLTAYLAGDIALEPTARAFAEAYHRDGCALYLDLAPAGAPPAVHARVAALWVRYAELMALPRADSSDSPA